jgi:hypothetical protein
MDIYDLRRQNLALLIRDRFGDNQSKFATSIGKKPDYISRCLSTKQHRKRIGEELAREIESLVDKLPRGWLDVSRSSVEPAAPAAPIIETRPLHEIQGRQLSAKEEQILDLVCALTREQQDEFLKPLRAAVAANRVTQKHLKNGLKTIGNHRMESEFGIPGEHEKGPA